MNRQPAMYLPFNENGENKEKGKDQQFALRLISYWC